jgi:DNA polymerase-1
MAAEGRPRILLIDTHSLVHRAFHAVPAVFSTSRGEATNAVYGFTSMLLKAWAELQPDYLAAGYDRPVPTFRHVVYGEYKATRAPVDEGLRAQFRRVREVLEAFGIPIYELDGYEADDILGTLARQAAQRGLEVYILSSDNDMLQLVDACIRVVQQKPRQPDLVIMDEAAVRERFGVAPWQLPDYKALAGDAADNIPRVPGLGEKTAARLIAQFGTVEALYENLALLPDKLRTVLEQHREQVLQSKKLATIATRAPVELDLERCRAGRFERERVLALFRELEFKSLVSRVPHPSPPGAEQLAGAVGKGKGEILRPGAAFLESAGPVASRGPSEPAGAGTATPLSGGEPAAGRPAPGRRRAAAAPAQAALFAPAPIGAHAASVLHDLSQTIDCVRALLRRPERPAVAVYPLLVHRGSINYDVLGLGLAWPDGSEGSFMSCWLPFEPGEGARAVARALLEDATLPKVYHDAKTALVALHGQQIQPAPPAFDAMVAAYLVNPAQRAVSLKDLVFGQLGEELPDPTAGLGRGETLADLSPDVQAHYAAHAATALLRVRAGLEQALRERGVEALYRELELPLIPVLAHMELRGVRLDTVLLAQLSRELAERIREVERSIYADVGHTFNINSPQQLGAVLASELRLPLTKRTKTGWSTDVSVLEELRGLHPVIEKILEYRQLTKLKSTYVDALPALINPRTGRLHTSFNQTVAATGRLSSSNPNLQNIPIRTELGRRIRQAFIADEGMVLLSADYSQIELRILAHVTQDENLLAAFRAGEDIHTSTAAAVFGVSPDQVTPEMRNIAKRTNFGIIYGISDHGLSIATGMSRRDAAEFIERYLARFPSVRAYMERTIQQARELGYVSTLLGRRRYLPELHSSNSVLRQAAERMAINHPIQGTAADIIKLAMVRIHRALHEEQVPAEMILQVHDELVFEVAREDLDRLARLVRPIMEQALPLSVPLEADLAWGPNWQDLVPLEPS